MTVGIKTVDDTRGNYFKDTFLRPAKGAYMLAANDTSPMPFHAVVRQYAESTYTNKGSISIAKVINPAKALRFVNGLAQLGIAKIVDGLGPKESSQPVVQGVVKGVLMSPFVLVSTVTAPLANLDEIPQMLGKKSEKKEEKKEKKMGPSDPFFDSLMPSDDEPEPEKPAPVSRRGVISKPTGNTSGESSYQAAMSSVSAKQAEKKEKVPSPNSEPVPETIAPARR